MKWELVPMSEPVSRREKKGEWEAARLCLEGGGLVVVGEALRH